MAPNTTSLNIKMQTIIRTSTKIDSMDTITKVKRYVQQGKGITIDQQWYLLYTSWLNEAHKFANSNGRSGINST